MKIQRTLTDHAHEEAQWKGGPLAEVEEVYRKSTDQRFKPVEFSHLVETVLNSRILFIGDYHTLRESQKTPLRIANQLLETNRSIIFCTEAFYIDDQPLLNSWLAEEIDDHELLNQTEWNSKWGFPWRNFGMQMQFFKDRSIPIMALNSHENIVGSSFAARDRIAAMRLVEVLRENPDDLLIVSFGDLHMAHDHLPGEVQRVLKSLGEESVPFTILFQNVDTIYWKLAEMKLEQTVSTVQLKDGNFCFMGTTPLVKIQSALNWYSNELELEESLGLDLPPTISSSVMHDQIWLIIETLCEFLEVPSDEFQDFSVYTSRNLDLLDHLTGDRKLTPEEVQKIQGQFEVEESCYLPRSRIIFLGNLSTRHAAEEASHHINFVLSGLFREEIPANDNFYETTIRECLGYFGSKVVDHNRKPLGNEEIDRVIEDLESGYSHPFHAETMESLLATRRFLSSLSSGQIPKAKDIIPQDSNQDVISGVAHLIGYLLGEWIYNALVEGEIDRSEVRELFSDPMAGSGSGMRLFEYWIEKVSQQP